MPENEKLPLSVVMIAAHEAENLPRSLGSVCTWVSEIIVVLGDASDESRGIAESFGATVHVNPWSSMAEQKAVAASFASQPWILNLDADEEVPAELAKEIRRLVTADDPVIGGASFPRRTWFLGRWIRHGDWYPDRVVRLFRSGKYHWEGEGGHDRVVVEGPVFRCQEDLLHYSFRDIRAYLDKMSAFTDRFVESNPDRAFSWAAVLFRPCWRFFRAYVLRQGFRDGFPGLFVALSTAYFAFARYARLYERNRLR